MRKTLITPAEVVLYSPVNGNTNNSIYCSIIPMAEQKLFRECIGSDFYKALLADLRAVPAGVQVFDAGSMYLQNDVVEYEAELYTVIQDTDGSQTPCNENYFQPYGKFNTTAYQTLWDDYLKYVLAFQVELSTTTYTAISQEAAGLVRKKGETFDPANTKELGLFKTGIATDLASWLDNMNEFLMQEENETVYPLYKGWQDKQACAKGESCTPRKAQRFYGFNIYDDEPNCFYP